MDVANAKKLVSECVDLANKLQSSAVCSDVARVTLHKQIRDLQAMAADVDDDWSRKRAELETELTHLENYYISYQVCDDDDDDDDTNIETAESWYNMAIKLIREIGRRITTVTEDDRETAFLFQRLSVALQKRNAISFQNTVVSGH